MGDIDKAIQEYARSLDEDPGNAVAALGLANLAFNAGELQTAAEAYEQYLHLNEEPSAVTHFMAALAYEGLLDNQRAIEHMQAAADLEPENAESRIELGQFLVRLGRLAEAKETFDRAELLDPTAPGLFVGRASLAYQQCKPMEAIAAMERAASLAPKDSLYQGMLASYLLSAGRQEDAGRIIEALAARPLDDQLAHLLAGTGLSTLGQFDAAELELARVAAASGAPPLFVSLGAGALGDLYVVDDKLSAAEDAYRQALAAFPSHAGAQLALGDLVFMNGDMDAARDAYAQVEPMIGVYAMNFGVDTARAVQVGLHMRLALLQQKSGAGDGGQTELAAAGRMVDEWLNNAPASPTGRFLSAALKSIADDDEAADAEYRLAIECDATLETTREQLEKFWGRVMP
jgi:tetratricopeptide (TPR) repeat protein